MTLIKIKMVENFTPEEDEQYELDAELDASEYGLDQMAGMPGYGEMQDPYAAEVNQMVGDYQNELMGVMEGQGAPEAAAEYPAYEEEEELPGDDPWAAAEGALDDEDFEENPENMQGPGSGQFAA